MGACDCMTRAQGASSPCNRLRVIQHSQPLLANCHRANLLKSRIGPIQKFRFLNIWIKEYGSKLNRLASKLRHTKGGFV